MFAAVPLAWPPRWTRNGLWVGGMTSVDWEFNAEAEKEYRRTLAEISARSSPPPRDIMGVVNPTWEEQWGWCFLNLMWTPTQGQLDAVSALVPAEWGARDEGDMRGGWMIGNLDRDIAQLQLAIPYRRSKGWAAHPARYAAYNVRGFAEKREDAVGPILVDGAWVYGIRLTDRYPPTVVNGELMVE